MSCTDPASNSVTLASVEPASHKMVEARSLTDRDEQDLASLGEDRNDEMEVDPEVQSPTVEDLRTPIKHALREVFDKSFEFDGDYAIFQSYYQASNPDLTIDGFGMVAMPTTNGSYVQKTSSSPIFVGIHGSVTRCFGTYVRASAFPKTPNCHDASFKKSSYVKQDHGFVPSDDAQTVDGLFATLVIMLPSEFTGGQVHASYGGRGKTFDPSSNSLFATTALSWFPTVLSYNLAYASSSVRRLPSLDGTAQDLERVLRTWKHADKEDNSRAPRMLSHMLHSTYPSASLSFKKLKGRDASLALILRQDHWQGIQKLLALSDRTIDETECLLQLISGTEAGQICQKTEVDFEEFLFEESYFKSQDGKDRQAGMWLTSSHRTVYYRTILLIWPESQHGHVINFLGGLDSILTSLRKNQSETPSERDLQSIGIALAGACLVRFRLENVIANSPSTKARLQLVSAIQANSQTTEPADNAWLTAQRARILSTLKTASGDDIVPLISTMRSLGGPTRLRDIILRVLPQLRAQNLPRAWWEGFIQTIQEAEEFREDEGWSGLVFSAAKPAFEDSLYRATSSAARFKVLPEVESLAPSEVPFAEWCNEKRDWAAQSLLEPSLDDADLFVELLKERKMFLRNCLIPKLRGTPYTAAFWLAFLTPNSEPVLPTNWERLIALALEDSFVIPLLKLIECLFITAQPLQRSISVLNERRTALVVEWPLSHGPIPIYGPAASCHRHATQGSEQESLEETYRYGDQRYSWPSERPVPSQAQAYVGCNLVRVYRCFFKGDVGNMYFDLRQGVSRRDSASIERRSRQRRMSHSQCATLSMLVDIVDRCDLLSPSVEDRMVIMVEHYSLVLNMTIMTAPALVLTTYCPCP
ncbi:hypothetical protein BV25DRAFT_1834924 [Artomyces pyxidatus]|uniref:Uncharacterized protein n=1 Tax=Artomyces pyxidatus TaxID=48021 RepID=A0ACB8TFH2_9AGAM|nr:hypothetical protein BV25DRAFT_1834924 [Artomyces pyxidatus]